MANQVQVGRASTSGSGNLGVSSNRTVTNYYSGSDVRVYFGDTWVDEIVEVNFSLQEQVAPIYGYGSYTYDVAARGNRIVVGEFVVNFKEVGYLHTVLDWLSSEMKDSNEWFSLYEYNMDRKDSKGKVLGKNFNLPPEQVIKNFDTLAGELEISIWGSTTSGRKSNLAAFTNERTKDTYFYGTRNNSKNQLMRKHGFNVLITYGGACEGGRTSTGYRTAQSLMGVQLTGLSQRVDPSGNPIQEVYSFIAKDITGNMTKPV